MESDPCLFYKKASGVAIMVHADDVVAVGPEAHLVETRKTLEDTYKLKAEKLGCSDGCKSEMRILNKVVRATESGITLEADPRHADLVVKDLDLMTAKISAVPGSKEEVSRLPGGVKAQAPRGPGLQGEMPTIAATQTRTCHSAFGPTAPWLQCPALP